MRISSSHNACIAASSDGGASSLWCGCLFAVRSERICCSSPGEDHALRLPARRASPCAAWPDLGLCANPFCVSWPQLLCSLRYKTLLHCLIQISELISISTDSWNLRNSKEWQGLLPAILKEFLKPLLGIVLCRRRLHLHRIHPVGHYIHSSGDCPGVRQWRSVFVIHCVSVLPSRHIDAIHAV